MDSVASSQKSEDEITSQDDDDDQGWGWFSNGEEDDGVPAPNDVPLPHAASATPSAPAARKHHQEPAVKRAGRSMVRPLSMTQLEPVGKSTASTGHSAGGGASLLLLGSELWPTRTPKQAKPVRARDSLVVDLVAEARSKNLPLVTSTVIVLGRGLAMGFAVRSVPMFISRRGLITRDALRTGLFVGLSMAALHVMALSDNANQVKRYAGQAAVLTPLLAILPKEARTSATWFMVTRLVEAAVHGGLRKVPRSVHDNVPFSRWIFALGNAQVINNWLFHRQAMPPHLVAFMDSVTTFKSMDVARTLASGGDPLQVQTAIYKGARLGTGLLRDMFMGVVRSSRSMLGLVVSDAFSAAALLGPLIWRGPLAVAELLFALGTDVALSSFMIVALSRALKRSAPSDAFMGGLFAGLVSSQLESSEEVRIEVGLYMFTNALRALVQTAVERKVLPRAGSMIGSLFLYFVSLCGLLASAENSASWLIIGRSFREVLRRSLIV